MNKIFKTFQYEVLITILLLLLNQNIYSQQWVSAGIVSNLGNEPSISVVNANNVWIAGGVPDTPRIYRTTNGGTNWFQVQTSGITTEIFCIWAPFTHLVYVAEGVVSGNAKLLKTTNSGDNWETVLQTLPNGGHFNSLIFSRNTPQVGGALAEKIYTTTNGGRDWVIQNTAVQGVSSAQNSLMLIDQNFFGFGLNNGAARVRVTTNGGTQWSNQTVNIPGSYTSGFAYKDDKLTGLASTQTSMPNIARTTDGGITWNSVDIGPGLTGRTFLKWVSGTDVVYIIGANGLIKRSTNNGLNWVSMTTNGVTDITHFSFINVNNIIHGYAVSKNGNVIKLADSVLILTGLNTHNPEVPSEYKLFQNYPNPFNPSTTIKYQLPKGSNVSLKIYDIIGNEITTLVEKRQNAGDYEIEFAGNNLSSGIYFYRLSTVDFLETKRMILIK